MIQLTVKAKDSEVEQLLSYLNVKSEEGIEDSISLLERTLCWLRASTERHYNLDPSCEAALRLSVDAPSPTASVPSHKPSE
jgi:hypothetical protein